MKDKQIGFTKTNESLIKSTEKFFSSNYIDVLGTPYVNEIFNRNDWVSLGANNDWPQELLRIYQNSSPLHTGLVKKKVDMIAGLGFNPIAGLENFIGNQYSKEDLNMIAYKAAFDLVLFGGFYINIIWAKGIQKQIARIEHIPYEKVRAQKPCELDFNGQSNDTNDVLGYYISKDWLKWRRSENEPKLIPTFNPDLYQEQPSQLLSTMSYTPGMDYYSLPDYMSVINWLRLDYQISVFHLQSVRNGFMPSMIITMNNGSQSTDEEKQREYQQLKERYSSALNAGDFLMVWADTKDTAPTFTPVQLSDSDNRYKDLMIQMNQEILVGHGATSPVGGIETSGKLGTADEIKDAYKLFQLTKIAQMQEIIERTFNKLAKINGYTDKLTLKPYSLIADAEQANTSTATSGGTTSVEEQPMSNDALRGLTGKENIDFNRIIKQFKEGKTDEVYATGRLMAYGLTLKEAKRYLGIKDENNEKLAA
jgi:hypothetical protein